MGAPRLAFETWEFWIALSCPDCAIPMKKIYDDAGHAFQNINNKESYREADTADVRKRTVEFLATTMKN